MKDLRVEQSLLDLCVVRWREMATEGTQRRRKIQEVLGNHDSDMAFTSTKQFTEEVLEPLEEKFPLKQCHHDRTEFL